MRRRRLIILSLVLGFCVAILAAVYFLVPAKNWPGKEELETQTILYEGNEYQYREEIVNILFVGVDAYEAIEEINHTADKGFADAIFLVSVDTKKRDCKITMIPRDTITSVFWLDEEGKVGGTETIQLTYQYTLGDSPKQSGELMKQAVSTLLYQVPIHRYCTLNYSSVSLVNDMVGGVDVEVLEDLQWVNPEFILGETIHLEGDSARQYVGERNTKEQKTSLTRLERQKQYMKALFEKAKAEIKKDPTLVFRLCWKLREHMSTDLSLREILYLVSVMPDIRLEEVPIQPLEGEQTEAKYFEEFYPEETALKQLVIERFFEKKS